MKSKIYYQKWMKNSNNLFFMKRLFFGMVLLIVCGLGIYGGYRAYRYFSYVPTAIPVGRIEKTITLIEGWTLYDVAKYFETNEIAKQKDFFAFVGTPTKFGHPTYRKTTLPNEFPFLLEIPDGGNLEGYLFPDTYRIYADASLEDVIRKILNNFDTRITPEMRTEIKKQHRTLYQEVVMGSIIEREVATDADRPKVADILWSRIRVGMPLQVDSSVNYITQKKDAAISGSDRFINSPYNTYRFKSLPIGPISSPGVKSIVAAIWPEITPYTYFLTDKQGNVHYGRTLDEHNMNKVRYLK